MSSRDTSFYYSFLVLPARKRHAIIAVWDFCRAVDDAVDEVMPEEAAADGRAPVAVGDGPAPDARSRAAAAIAAWRQELDLAYADAARTPQGIALQPFIREFKLPRRHFDELIDGVAMDLAHVRYATFDDLREYCLRVASAVGLICVEIFGYRDPATRRYAVDLGMALQLTNILRDVATDLQRGRIYLPAEDLVRFGVSEGDLRAGRMTAPLRELVRFECDRARSYYARAAAALPRSDARRLVAAEIMGAIYYAILRRIERSDYDVFTQRIRVPRPWRALLAAGVWLRTLVLPIWGRRSTRTADRPNPELRTLNPEPRTLNPEPRTPNPEPGTWNPEPGTPNPEPNPEHEPRSENREA